MESGTLPLSLTLQEIEQILYRRYTEAQRQAERDYDDTHKPGIAELRTAWHTVYKELNPQEPK